MRFEPSALSYSDSYGLTDDQLDALTEKKTNAPSPERAAMGLGLVAALVVLPTLLVYPWVIKQFKPEWSYGKRVAAGLAGSVVISAVRGVGK